MTVYRIKCLSPFRVVCAVVLVSVTRGMVSLTEGRKRVTDTLSRLTLLLLTEAMAGLCLQGLSTVDVSSTGSKGTKCDRITCVCGDQYSCSIT